MRGGIALDTRTIAAYTNRLPYAAAPVAGVWVGVELDEAKGKSDGEVKGTRLFTCPPSHGSVLRRTALTVLDAGKGAKKQSTVSDLGGEFRSLVGAKTAAAPARDTAGRIDVLAAKAGNASNGLETSTFTVCARIRPTLGDEADRADGFVVVSRAIPSVGEL